MTDLGTLAGTSSSYANDINNAGQVVGGSETAAGERGAFIWEGGRMRQLPELERPEDDGGGTIAMGINGQVRSSAQAGVTPSFGAETRW